MKCHPDAFIFSQIDSHGSHNRGDHPEGHAGSGKQTAPNSRRRKNGQLPPHQTADLPSRHSYGLQQPVIPDVSGNRKVHDIVDQQVGAQTGDSGQPQDAPKDLNRRLIFRIKKQVLLLFQVQALSKCLLLRPCHVRLLKIDHIPSGAYIRQLLPGLVVKSFGHKTNIFGPVSVPHAGDPKLPCKFPRAGAVGHGKGIPCF